MNYLAVLQRAIFPSERGMTKSVLFSIDESCLTVCGGKRIMSLKTVLQLHSFKCGPIIFVECYPKLLICETYLKVRYQLVPETLFR